ncbi:MAG: hypothetical protein LBE53_14430 [Paucimonas sp.]|jgi:Ni/Co efflux regulator RcnB|nr:hypothetical protein [Paucimonas sp.]
MHKIKAVLFASLLATVAASPLALAEGDTTQGMTPDAKPADSGMKQDAKPAAKSATHTSKKHHKTKKHVEKEVKKTE